MNTRRNLTLHGRLLGAACMAGLLTIPVSAQQNVEHAHAHHHEGSAVSQLQLDDGARWPTDESLRSGMAAIRAAFDADHPAIHAGTETDAQYEALATRIEAQVNSIVEQCKLPAQADANLHFVIADLSQGVIRMRGAEPGKTRHEGAALVHGALRAYGRYFDDPSWVPETPMKH